MTLTLDGKDALTYRLWFQLMLGLVPRVCAMQEADRLYRREAATISRVAAMFARVVLPRIWPHGPPTLHRGLRLEDPGLAGRPLPPHPAYKDLPAISFSEDPHVAAYFADPGPLGLPALSIPNSVTGRLGLPDHGYIGTATVGADDVLFHWRYAVKFPWLLAGVGPDYVEGFLGQREVVVRNRPDLVIQLEAFAVAAADYIAERYPGGRWIPPTACIVFC
jgi:hypothetical protein